MCGTFLMFPGNHNRLHFNLTQTGANILRAGEGGGIYLAWESFDCLQPAAMGTSCRRKTQVLLLLLAAVSPDSLVVVDVVVAEGKRTL